MKTFFKNLPIFILCALALIACSESAERQPDPENNSKEIIAVNQVIAPLKKYKGALIGGYKGDSIFFEISEDGNRIENLTFKGHWRCDGKIERIPIVGPEGSLPIVNGEVDDHVSDPPDGGATAWRFDLKASFKGKQAEGKFRMNINALNCNTGMLSYTAVQY